ncbi:MAG: DNA adenine methylase [Oscillospiraceae bacterium]|jgi:DNA adenine methylase|nr:DNA adenine methylase [Oscillospiraceae bacterium]
MAVKPFLKWAGGKGQLLGAIRAKYPAELGADVTKYAEPFVGGGAVLFDILESYRLNEIYISDINRELILTYTTLSDNADALIAALSDMERAYLSASEEARKAMYYAKRDRFNALKTERSESVELAALFVFLNKTCFNGLYRVNAKGAFNVPQGSYRNPTICDADNLRAVSEKLQGVTIVCGDYALSRGFIDEHTFAYFDPPYRPLTATSSFTAYSQDGFGDAEQTELARFIDEMTERGAWVVASNSDPKNADENDDFFDRLYRRHTITRIDATRAINSISSGRGRVSELLIARG